MQSTAWVFESFLFQTSLTYHLFTLLNSSPAVDSGYFSVSELLHLQFINQCLFSI